MASLSCIGYVPPKHQLCELDILIGLDDLTDLLVPLGEPLTHTVKGTLTVATPHEGVPDRREGVHCRRGGGGRQTVGVSVCLLVDRSMPMPLPPYGWELCDLRSRLVADLAERLGPRANEVIGYAEVARNMSIDRATKAGPEAVYGANLQHALLLGRASTRETGAQRLIQVAYNLPSAHHISGTDVYFNYPPVTESLDAARTEAASAGSEGTRIDTLLLVHPSDAEERIASHDEYFRQISEQTGGSLILVRPDDSVDAAVHSLTD